MLDAEGLESTSMPNSESMGDEDAQGWTRRPLARLSVINLSKTGECLRETLKEM